MAAVTPIAVHPQVAEVRYLNQSDTRSVSGLRRDRRCYYQVLYQTAAGDVWKLDVSFWLSDDAREDEVRYQADLVRRLDPETRLAILWIKSQWVQSVTQRDPAYGHGVASIDIYDAVLNHGVRTPAAFDAYLAARGKPTRSNDRAGAA